MEFLLFSTFLVFAMGGVYLIAILITIVWLIIVIRFGFLPIIFEDANISTHQKQQINSNATRVQLGMILFGVPMLSVLCCTIPFLGIVDIGVLPLDFLYSPVWFVLILEGWSVFIYHSRLNYLANYSETFIGKRHFVNRNIEIITIFLGVITGLVGFIWWNYSNLSYRLGLILSPITALLAIGIIIMLFVYLKKDFTVKNEEENPILARNLTRNSLVTFFILSAIGGVWSGLMYNTFQCGSDFFLVPG